MHYRLNLSTLPLFSEDKRWEENLQIFRKVGAIRNCFSSLDDKYPKIQNKLLRPVKKCYQHCIQDIILPYNVLLEIGTCYHIIE